MLIWILDDCVEMETKWSCKPRSASCNPFELHLFHFSLCPGSLSWTVSQRHLSHQLDLPPSQHAELAEKQVTGVGLVPTVWDTLEKLGPQAFTDSLTLDNSQPSSWHITALTPPTQDLLPIEIFTKCHKGWLLWATKCCNSMKYKHSCLELIFLICLSLH